MRIDLGDNVSYEVVVGGTVHKLREPTAKDVAALSKLQSGEEASQIDAFIGFVVKLGMPQVVAESLGVTKIKKLADALVAEMGEKK